MSKQATNDTKKLDMESPEAEQSMSNVWIAVTVAILLAFPAGYVIGNVTAESESEVTISQGTDNHADDDHTHANELTDTEQAHTHNPYEVPDGVVAPAITEIAVSEDAKSGWNLSFETANFTFSPQNASGDHVEGEGHAHLYVDGEKITRLYSVDYYLGDLSEGSHTVEVTLNTNDHKDYSVNGVVISQSVELTDMHHQAQ